MIIDKPYIQQAILAQREFTSLLEVILRQEFPCGCIWYKQVRRQGQSYSREVEIIPVNDSQVLGVILPHPSGEGYNYWIGDGSKEYSQTLLYCLLEICF